MKSAQWKFKPAFCVFPGCLTQAFGDSPDSPDPISKRGVQVLGFYTRKGSVQRIRRYRCRACGRTFSEATREPPFRQKRRDVNSEILKLLCSNVSQRRVALLLQINRKTVARKLRFLADQAQRAERAERIRRESLPEAERPQFLQFDEMESFIHTKCKSVSIPMLICAKTRRIYGISVASIPAKGPLAEFSRKKYGPREDHRKPVALNLLRALAPSLHPEPQILSDKNTSYPGWLKAVFPQVTHGTVKGKRGCVVGQGELKALVHDPLFSLNHTAAMVRANVGRMIRRTWNTSKTEEGLLAALQLYAYFHNTVLVPLAEARALAQSKAVAPV